MDNKRRMAIQAIATLVQNANWKGFWDGKIYTGATKQACVPGLNCYSCPGALGACPVGALQNSLSSLKFRFPYYVLGLLIFFGALLGRVVCGFLCPFGFLQDLVYKIPFFKKVKKWKFDNAFRYLKYIVLILLVVVLPIVYKLTPFFCKYLCPSGTIAGILLAITNKPIVVAFGKLFSWKLIILLSIILLSLMIFRPFCKYLCPLGAFYAPFNKISVVSLHYDAGKCTKCGMCEAACDMCINPSVSPNSTECIRCARCVSECPEGALHLGLRKKGQKEK